MTPTSQQQSIIEAEGNLVIIANPGSGKTFVISRKVRNIIEALPEHNGVVAISYTNKASAELKTRCLMDGASAKASFFGTVDSFFITEIVIPFGKHLFGLPRKDITTLLWKDLSETAKEQLNWQDSDHQSSSISSSKVRELAEMFVQGNLVLETVGHLALHVLDNSPACRNYLRARYTHIFIDEYQDCGRQQHDLFLRLKKIGLSAIAVGDANQSIFQFSGKSSVYLIHLAENERDFKLFPLDLNHRCHPSIINYSLLLLNKHSTLLEFDELRVYEKQIIGSESDVATWLANRVQKFIDKFKIKRSNRIAVLVRGTRTGATIHQDLTLPSKFFETTVLDEEFTLWAEIFRSLLAICFDNTISRTDFLETFLDGNSERSKFKKMLAKIQGLALMLNSDEINTRTCIDSIIEVATTLQPNGVNEHSIRLLEQVVQSPRLLESYKPAKEEEIQIMTLHKSKGLEFDLVFHLDLHTHILPMYGSELLQELNLHYVGVTRARQCCVLVHSTRRTKADGKVTAATPSDFLRPDYLAEHRIKLKTT